MADGLETYLPDSRDGKAFLFLVLFLVVMPAVVVLGMEAPYVLTTAAGVGFLAWLVHALFLGGSDDEATGGADPLTTLQDRYARGEIDEAEFERRLDNLVETEDRDLEELAAGEKPVLEREP